MFFFQPFMKYILSCSNAAEKLQLPVPPSSCEIKIAHNNTVMNINDIGEINMIGKTGLMSITLESFFPAQDYYFCQYHGFPMPYKCVKQILRWKDSGNPIRLLITKTNINHTFAIESFEYKENDGTGDIYFTLALKEYKFLTNIDTQKNTKKSTGLKTRTDERKIIKRIIMHQGEDIIDAVNRARNSVSDINNSLDYYKGLLKNPPKPGDIIKLR